MKIPNKISIIFIVLTAMAGLALFGLFYFSGNDYGVFPSLIRLGPVKQ
jgi:hypothetical protein